MKAKLPLRRFGVDDAIAAPLSAEFSNRTAISRTANHVSLICPVCGTGFTRKAAEAKRNAVSYCSRACAGFACRKQVDVRCRVCSAPFAVKQSHFGRVTCCSSACKKKLLSELATAKDIAGWKNGVFQSGEKAAGAKLTEDQARAILADKRKHADIAQDYGITRSAVSQMKRGESWAQLLDA